MHSVCSLLWFTIRTHFVGPIRIKSRQVVQDVIPIRIQNSYFDFALEMNFRVFWVTLSQNTYLNADSFGISSKTSSFFTPDFTKRPNPYFPGFNSTLLETNPFTNVFLSFFVTENLYVVQYPYCNKPKSK